MSGVGAELVPVGRAQLVVTRPVWRSPLAGQDVLTGGVVTDPVQVVEIRARVEFFARPWWRRVGRRVPSRPVVALPLPKIIMSSPREVTA